MSDAHRRGVRSIWLALLLIATSAYVLPRIGLRGEYSTYELFRQIKLGMTKNEVFEILGTPTAVETGEIAARISDKGTEKIKEVLVYYSPTKLLSARVVIAPDNTVGRVICAVRPTDRIPQ